MIRKIHLTAVGIGLWAVSSVMAASFQGLGDLSGGSFSSCAFSVSADGTVVVGYGTTASGEQAFRWTQSTGMVSLPNPANGSFKQSEASNISADGSTVVGWGDPVGNQSANQAFRWTQAEGMVSLPSLNGATSSGAGGVSADGAVVAGTSGQYAFRWTQSTGIVSLGCLPGNTMTRTLGLSADGSVVVGSSFSANYANQQAFRWTPSGGMQGLGFLSGDSGGCWAHNVSPDGSVIVGTSGDVHSFRWTQSTGMVGLGSLPGKTVTHPMGASNYGSIIVGVSYYADASQFLPDAFVWDAGHGMRNLQTVLETEYGLNLTGWNLDVAYGITPDGTCIVGQGTNPSGQQEAFRIEVSLLPDPNGPVLNLSSGDRFDTIQAALAYARSGQVIQISPGTYKENLTVPNIPLTIRSTNPQDSAVVSLTSLVGDGSAAVVTLAAGTALRSIQGLTITGGTDGIVCAGAKLQLSSCVITGHRDCGIEVSEESAVNLEHCIIAGNVSAGLRSNAKSGVRRSPSYSTVSLAQCTVIDNQGYALSGGGITASNSILYGNGTSAGKVQISGSSIAVSYSDVQGGFAGQSNIDVEPAFVASGTWTDPNTYVLGDCHLKSKAGHWNSNTCTWVSDEATSPCIDAGDPTAAFNVEPAPNGGRANLGAYGNTTEASRTVVE